MEKSKLTHIRKSPLTNHYLCILYFKTIDKIIQPYIQNKYSIKSITDFIQILKSTHLIKVLRYNSMQNTF